jgi:hypothetical protein
VLYQEGAVRLEADILAVLTDILAAVPVPT